MPKNLVIWLLWLGFTGYAFLLAPPDQPDTFDLIKNLSTGQVAGINPLIVALFNIMGVIPLIYSAVLYADGRGQKVRAFPFAFLSFFVGAFGLMPYLALRQPNPTFTGKKNWVIKVFDSRIYGIGVFVAAAGLLTFGLTQGNWSDFVQQWQTSRFIHVMSLDFCALCALFPVLLGDDMARRGLNNRQIFWLVALVPLLGAAAYIALRPSIQEQAATEATNQPVSVG